MGLCVLQGVSSDITDLEILVGRGRGVVVVHRIQHLFVVQMKEKKSIFYILRIYSYFMPKVHTSVNVLTYKIKKLISAS